MYKSVNHHFAAVYFLTQHVLDFKEYIFLGELLQLSRIDLVQSMPNQKPRWAVLGHLWLVHI